MHKIQMYENLMDMLEREVKEIESRGNLDPQSLDVLYKIALSIKAIDKHMFVLEGKEMSQNSYAMSRASYARAGRDGDSDGRYSEDSFRSNQSRGGSYERSRASSRDSMVQKLEGLMDAAHNEHERQIIMDCINKLQ